MYQTPHLFVPSLPPNASLSVMPVPPSPGAPPSSTPPYAPLCVSGGGGGFVYAVGAGGTVRVGGGSSIGFILNSMRGRRK